MLLPLLAAALLVSPVPAASADEASDAPVTTPDRVTLRGGALDLVDVLGNDSDPNGDELAICRIEVPDGAPLDVDSPRYEAEAPEGLERAPLFVRSVGYRAGTYTVTYWACDHDYLTPATVTVVVTRTRPVRARKVAPHVVRFANPDSRAVRVSLLSFDPQRPDSGPDPVDLRLRPGQSTRVRVPGRVMFWSASARTGDAGAGVIRGLGR